MLEVKQSKARSRNRDRRPTFLLERKSKDRLRERMTGREKKSGGGAHKKVQAGPTGLYQGLHGKKRGDHRHCRLDPATIKKGRRKELSVQRGGEEGELHDTLRRERGNNSRIGGEGGRRVEKT